MKKFRVFVLALDIFALLAFFFLDDLAKYMIDFFPECFFYSHFGIECVTCGATRCVYSFFSFDFKAAFLYNQYIFLLIIYAIILFAALNLAAIGIKKAKTLCRALLSWYAFVSVGVLCLVFALVRFFA